MSFLYTKLALGVDWSGEGLRLVALGRRLSRTLVVDSLSLPDAREDGARKQVDKFLDKNRIREARVTACVPRSAVFARFLDLPAEAERQLRNVVGYQIDVLSLWPGAQVKWDCAVVARNPKREQIRVIVVLIEKARLDSYVQVLSSLGLKLHSLTLAAACLIPLLAESLPESALIACGRDGAVELIGLRRGRLCATRDVPLEPGEDAGKRFELELHGARAGLPVSDPAGPPMFRCGDVPEAIVQLIPESTLLPPLKLRWSMPAKFDLGAQLSALAAALSGLERKPAIPINLLPETERKGPAPWSRAPLYALGSTAVLLALLAATHAWIEKRLYARALDRQINRLEPQAALVRQRSRQVNHLEERAGVLEGARAQTWQKLRLLGELTHLLPDTTWVQDVSFGEGTIEMSGYSARAADLVKPLENSPYFTQVEFTSPITVDAQNKEIFRIRIHLKPAVRP